MKIVKWVYSVILDLVEDEKDKVKEVLKIVTLLVIVSLK